MTSVQEKMKDLFGTGNRQIAEIIPDFLYLSDIGCASDDAVLSEAGFTHVISILSAPIPWLGPSPSATCQILHIKCDDAEEEDIQSHFETTNAFIEQAFRENQLLESLPSSPASVNSFNSPSSTSGSSSLSSPISPMSPRTPNTPNMSNMPSSPNSPTGTGKRNKVLCHCLAGISRSPTIIAAYLLTLGMKSEEALDLLRAKRTVVEPNRGFIQQLAMYEQSVQSRPQSRLPSPPQSPQSPQFQSPSQSQALASVQAPAPPVLLQPRAPAPLSLYTHLSQSPSSSQSQPQPPSPSPSLSQPSQPQLQLASQCPLQLHPQPMRSRASLSIQTLHRNTATNTASTLASLDFNSSPNGRIQPSLITQTQKTLFVG